MSNIYKVSNSPKGVWVNKGVVQLDGARKTNQLNVAFWKHKNFQLDFFFAKSINPSSCVHI